MILSFLFPKRVDPRTYLSADRSDAFRAFISSFFPMGLAEAREGTDDQSLRSLAGDEQELAERILIEQIGGGFHTNACRGVAILKSRAAIRRLRKTLRGSHAFASALALFRIDADDSVVPILVREASIPDHWTGRMQIAIDLRHVPRRAVVDQLVTMMRDPDELVRHHAVDSLCYLHGLKTSWDSFLEHMQASRASGSNEWPLDKVRAEPWTRIMDDDVEVREETISTVLIAIAGRPMRSDG